MEKFFKRKERGTAVRTELIAGMTTFFSMVYLLMVNAGVAAGGRTGMTSLFCGDGKKIKGSSWVIAGLFIAMLLLTH